MGKRVHIVFDEASRVRGRGGNFTVTADVLEVDLDLDELEQGPAEAIAEALGRGVANIGAAAKPSTVARRRRDGVSGTRMFNATGALAGGITAVASDDGYDVVAPPDRLESGARLEQLATFVPALDDPTTDSRVARALDKADAALLGNVTRKVR